MHCPLCLFLSVPQHHSDRSGTTGQDVMPRFHLHDIARFWFTPAPVLFFGLVPWSLLDGLAPLALHNKGGGQAELK